jgi:hypothetical protein
MATTVVCPECQGEHANLAITCSADRCRTGREACDFCDESRPGQRSGNTLWQQGRERRNARVQRGLTQQEEAQILGINPIDLNHVECGRRALEDVPRVRHPKE